MKIEDITAPQPRLSSEMRYASLHRTVEGGLATDKTWAELIEVCLELGLRDEAQSSFWQLKEPSLRRRLLTAMHRNGVMLDVTLGDAESGSRDGGQAAARTESGGETIGERIADGFRFLFADHMPMTAVVATVTFPLVVGLGGFLTSRVQNSMLLPLLALIPALSVVGLVGALGRRILVEASRGLEDPPEIPSFGTLLPEAGRFLLDATLLLAVFLGPAAALTQFDGVGWSAIAAALAVGLTLFPMAMALRQARDDWSCLRPTTLFRSIVRGGSHYMALVGTGAALFAPSLASVWMTGGSHLYLVLSVVGPLAVAPTFVMSRLLGQFLFAHRKALPVSRPATPPSTVPAATVRKPLASQAAATPRVTGSMRAPSHPEARGVPSRAAAAPAEPRPTAVPKSATSRPVMARSSQPKSAFAMRAPAPAEPRPAPAAMSQQVSAPRLRTREESTAPRAAPERAQTGHNRIVGDDVPDLTKLPGVSILKGDERVAAGAAAPIRAR